MITLIDQAAEFQAHLESSLGFQKAAKVVAFWLYRGTFGDAAARVAYGLIHYRANMASLRRAQRQIENADSIRRYRSN